MAKRGGYIGARQLGLTVHRKRKVRGSPHKGMRIKKFCQWLSHNATEAESALRIALVHANIEHKFQHPVKCHPYGFVVDFLFECAKDVRLIVEVDGGIHEEPSVRKKDEWRQRILEKRGYVVVRFTNEDVLKNTQQVINAILAFKPRLLVPLEAFKGKVGRARLRPP